MPRPNRGPHLWRDERTGVWFVRSFANGRRVLRSTGTGNRGEAEAVLGHALVELSRPSLPPVPTVADVLTAFVAARSHTIAAADVALKCRAVSAGMGWLAADAVTAPHVRAYVARRQAAGKAAGTIISEVAKLRTALRWASGEGLIPPPRPIRMPLSAPPRERWLEQAEVDRLLAAAVEPHVRVYLMISLHTAARREAVLELPWSAVDLDRRIIAFPAKVGGKRRVPVPINDDLRAEMILAFERRTTAWVIEYAGQRVRQMATGWRNALARSGIAHCTRHDLRRTAGSLMLIRGVPIELVSAVLGHGDIALTRRVYAKLAVDHLRPAVAKLSR